MGQEGTEEKIRERNRAAMLGFMAAVGSADFAALESICQPDLRVELPYSRPPKCLDGFPAYRAAVEPSLEVFRFTLSVTALHPTVDPDALIAEYTSDGIAVPTGKPYQNIYIGLWRFREGRVAYLREFFNPECATEALTPD